MKPFTLSILLLCFNSSCQPVNKDDDKHTPVTAVKAYNEPDPAQKDSVVKTRETRDR